MARSKASGDSPTEASMSTLRAAVATVLMALFTATGAAAQSLGDANGGLSAPPAAVNPAPGGGAQAPRVCSDCGVVESIRYVEQQEQASGVGAVAGGVLG